MAEKETIGQKAKRYAEMIEWGSRYADFKKGQALDAEGKTTEKKSDAPNPAAGDEQPATRTADVDRRLATAALTPEQIRKLKGK
jgi:hypothetical protein